VKKVLIHSRDTVEVWYCLQNAHRFADCSIRLPVCNRLRTSPQTVEPEVCFRIVYIDQGNRNGAPLATYRNQTVKIVSGPGETFEDTNTGTLLRVNCAASMREKCQLAP
jgi:hypothetical protein